MCGEGSTMLRLTISRTRESKLTCYFFLKRKTTIKTQATIKLSNSTYRPVTQEKVICFLIQPTTRRTRIDNCFFLFLFVLLLFIVLVAGKESRRDEWRSLFLSQWTCGTWETHGAVLIRCLFLKCFYLCSSSLPTRSCAIVLFAVRRAAQTTLLVAASVW